MARFVSPGLWFFFVPHIFKQIKAENKDLKKLQDLFP